MSLARKNLLIIALSMIVLIIVLYTASQIILLGRFAELEQQNVQVNVERLRNAVKADLALLESMTISWATWDDTWKWLDGFAQTGMLDQEYIDLNLYDQQFILSDADFVLAADTSGRVVYTKSASRITGEPMPDPADLSTVFSADSPFFQHNDENSTVVGLVILDGTPMLLSSSPILTSLGEGPVKGSFMFGRYLDEASVQDLAERIQLSLTTFVPGSSGLPADANEALMLLSQESPTLIRPINADTIAGYTLLDDVNGSPATLFKIEIPRTIFQQGQTSVNYFILFLMVTGLVMGTGSLLILQRLVFSRLLSFSRSVMRVSETGDMTERLLVQGHDELSSLGHKINDMLEALQLAQQHRSEHERQIRTQNESLVKANRELAVARRQADEATRLKSEFMATMSHELRTPLNAIIGYTEIQLAGMTGELNQEQHDYQQRVLANATHLLQLINEVLDLAKVEAGRIEIVEQPFSPQDLLDGAIYQTRGLIAEKPVELLSFYDDALPARIVGDYGRLKQIIVNLVSNAAKFTDQGSILVEMRKQDAHSWTIVVSDTGVGIPSHALEYIFEEFRQVDGTSQRKHGGTGLGLAIVRKLILLMKGNIKVQSKVGKGTNFTVTLPLVTESELMLENEPVAEHELAV